MGGFVMLQVAQLTAGIFGFDHIQDELRFLSLVAQQRLRTAQLVTHTHDLLHPVDAKKSTSAVGSVIDAYTAFYGAVDEFRSQRNFLDHWLDSGRVAIVLGLLDESRVAWETELHPRLASVVLAHSERNAHRVLVEFEGLIPGQIDRLYQAVTILEMDAQHNAATIGQFVLLLFVLSLVLAVAASASVVRRIAAPLRRLAGATREIAGGAYSRRLPVETFDEVGALSEHFNRMAQSIEQRTNRMWSLNQVAAMLTGDHTLSEMMDRVMYYAVDVSGARAACVVLYDQSQQRFGVPYSQGLSPSFLQGFEGQVDALANRVLSEGQPLECSDRTGAAYPLMDTARAEGLHAFLCLPLVTVGGRLGVIHFFLADRDRFDEDEVTALTSFAYLAANVIHNARLYERASLEARTDALTGLNNRRVFDQRIAEELSRARRYQKPFALALLDIDHFKELNDTRGHAAGDAVLRQFGHALMQQFRDVDIVCRYGGEEFAVIFPEISGSTARNVAERVRQGIAGISFQMPDGGQAGITVSVGVSCFPNCSSDVAGAIQSADQALYVAKQSGRNQVVLYRETLKARIEKDLQLIPQLLTESLDNVASIVTAISTKSAFLRPHTEKVLETALALARALGLGAAEMEVLRLAALLHDIGMLAIPDEILSRTSPLGAEERAQIQQHVVIGADLLGQVPALRDVAAVVRSHHERFDGQGYPDGLMGSEMPKLSRVLVIADAYGSMVSDWPGHRAMPRKQVLSRLRGGAGTQFDPEMVELLLRTLPELVSAA